MTGQARRGSPGQIGYAVLFCAFAEAQEFHVLTGANREGSRLIAIRALEGLPKQLG
jgi:hypothetical protein